jgi:hypothetical protein
MALDTLCDGGEEEVGHGWEVQRDGGAAAAPAHAPIGLLRRDLQPHHPTAPPGLSLCLGSWGTDERQRRRGQTTGGKKRWRWIGTIPRPRFVDLLFY